MDSVRFLRFGFAPYQEKLAPLYTQIACEFADLHDRTGRMEATGVIRQAVVAFFLDGGFFA